MKKSQSSFINKTLLSSNEKCGCYYCLNIFPTAEVTHWVDDGQTAICPKCSIDAIIPFESNNFKETLKKLNKEQFDF